MSTQSLITQVLDALQTATGYRPCASGDGYATRCPAHDDHKPSLVVSEGSDGRVLFSCHRGCDLERICKAIGWNVRDLHPARGPAGVSDSSAIFSFCDETDLLLYQEVRLPGKQFRMRRPLGDGTWIWDLDGIRRVPYRLPELCQACALGGEVIFAEGPKDVDRLVSEGFNATTVIGGAKGWRQEYSDYFQGLNLVICGDHDEPGQMLADTVTHSVYGKAASVKVVNLFPEIPISSDHGPDVSDWFNRGGVGKELQMIIDRTPVWRPTDSLSQEPCPKSVLPFLDIGQLMREPPSTPEPDLLVRSDGAGLFATGTVGLLIGAPESGKSWLTVEMVRQITSVGKVAVVLDWEGPARRFVMRFASIGGTSEQGSLVRYCNPGSIALDVVADEVLRCDPELVIIDSAAKLYAAHGLDEDRAGDALKLFTSLARPFADAGAFVVVVDHVVKALDARGRWPRGHGAKLGEADTAYTVHVSQPFGKAQSGAARLTVAKDRDSIVGPSGTEAATVRFEAVGDGNLRITLDPPRQLKQSDPEENGLSPSERRVLAVLRNTSEFLVREQLRLRVENDGLPRRSLKDRTVLQALSTLVDRGIVERDDDGPGTVARWRYIGTSKGEPSEQRNNDVEVDTENAA